MKKHSIVELDDVIDEILERNPDFVKQIDKIIEQSKTNEKDVYRSARRSR